MEEENKNEISPVVEEKPPEEEAKIEPQLSQSAISNNQSSNNEDMSANAQDHIIENAVPEQQVQESPPSSPLRQRTFNRTGNSSSNMNQAINSLIEWFIDYLDSGALMKFESSLWNQSMTNAVQNWIEDDTQRKLFFWVESIGLCISSFEPPILNQESFDSGFVCFLKIGNEKITEETIEHKIFQRTIKSGNDLKILQQLISLEVLPKFLADPSWPDNMKKEFLLDTHSFMAQLTESISIQEGKTKLYIPNEDFETELNSKDKKDLIQRLEICLNSWTRQIKEVLSNSSNQKKADAAGPLDEIQIWSSRKENLSNIREQLEKQEVTRILSILRTENSATLKEFQILMNQIKDGSLEAEDNLKYLNCLYNPCKELGKAKPNEIPKILPTILHCVRLILEKSNKYNTEEKIGGLLRKITNEIISRCKVNISIIDLLDGDVDECRKQIDNSIDCGEAWKKIALQYMKQMKGLSKEFVSKSGDHIFSSIETFSVRCSELKEICEAQVQFARKGKNKELPKFGGSKGAEIVGFFQEIETSFQKYLNKIRDLHKKDQDEILNFNSAKWQDEFTNFTNGMKNLENMFTTLITSAFETATTLEQAVELLEAFESLALRTKIKDHVDKKVLDVNNIFLDELKKAENATKSDIPIPLHQGKHGGRAVFIKSLINRIEKMYLLIDSLKFVEKTKLEQGIIEYNNVKKRLYSIIEGDCSPELRIEIKDIEENPSRLLKNHILITSDEASTYPSWFKISNPHPLVEKTRAKDKGHIESYFDKTLQKAIIEVVTWKKSITDQIPSFSQGIEDIVNIQREHLRVAQENVMVAVREYNTLLDLMSDAEKRLFSEHLKEIMSSIRRGLKGQGSLTWNVLGSLDGFVKEVKSKCDQVGKKLEDFVNSKHYIEIRLQKISSLKFLHFDIRKVQYLDEFSKKQDIKRAELQRTLRDIFAEIRNSLFEVYGKNFYQKGEPVQKAWFDHVKHIDECIQKELNSAIRTSFSEFHRATSLDEKKKKNPHQILKVDIELVEVNGEKEIQFNPSTQEIKYFIDNLLVDSVNVLSHQDFRPMVDAMFDEREKRIEEHFAQEKETNKMPNQVKKRKDFALPDEFIRQFKINRDFKKAMNDSAAEIFAELKSKIGEHCGALNNQLNGWRNKSNSGGEEPQFILKYNEEMKLDVQNLRGHIESFDLLQNDINEMTTVNEKICIQSDTTKIKKQLIEAIMSNQRNFLELIKQRTIDELDSIYKDFSTAHSILDKIPDDLKLLKTSIDELAKYQRKVEELKINKTPLEEKFKILDDYYNGFQGDDLMKRNNLTQKFIEFQEYLVQIKERNDEWYGKLNSVQTNKLDAFLKDIRESKERFTKEAPYSDADHENIDSAFLKLKGYRELTQDFRQKENSMSFGFNLFSIDYSEAVDLKKLEQEIEDLEMTWKMKEKWMRWWDDTKKFSFTSVNDELRRDLKKVCDQYLEEINLWSKDIKSWDVVKNLTFRIQHFKNHLPILKLLKNTAMRKRHWDRIQESVKTSFDSSSPAFTLDRFVEIGFDKVIDIIKDQWDVAQAEYKIETDKNKILYKYQNMDIKLEELKDTDIRYMSKDSHQMLTSNLEEDVVILSGMKRNVNAEAFMTEIDELELTLSKMTDALESLLSVQTQFLYMNSIKTMLLSIQQAVIQEFSKFEGIRSSFVGYFLKLKEDPNAQRFLTMQNFREKLIEMNNDLELIQKGLRDYLDNERSRYSRFFFVSDEDMFQLLGKGKDTDVINKYMKKMFEGIKSLEDNQKKAIHVATGPAKKTEPLFIKMISPDKEEVDFLTGIPISGDLEKMIKGVEDQMKLKLERLMGEALTHLEATLKPHEKYDKWLVEFPGQILITTAQIQWTKNCESILRELSFSNEKSDNKPEKGKLALQPQEPQKKKPTTSVWAKYKADFLKYLDELTKFSRKYTNELIKLKLTALMTIELHARDLIDSVALNCSSLSSFEWLKQLRFYVLDQNEGNIKLGIQQLTADKGEKSFFDYGWEYQGNNGRLVITPLTDKCYITLTQAMFMKKGGAPQGPAGTGKTETVKDLGKNMAKFVFIFNCSDGLELSSLIRMFAGFAGTGSWGCFDEFNRIEVDVLSVVAIEIAKIFDAQAAEETSVDFEGKSGCRLNKNCCIFITMNPGYAGRSELPDNLKALFRPVAMMVPDSSMICKITLQSCGFRTSDFLSKKVDTLYSLMVQQLTKQGHYDFGLRAIKSVLVLAGSMRQKLPSPDANKGKPVDQDEEADNEQKMLIKAIIDMNYPKFVAEDIPFFDALLEDMFRGMDKKDFQKVNDQLKDAIVSSLESFNLRVSDIMVTKSLQLYNTKITRHGNMIVGKAYSGKTTCWRILQEGITKLASQGISGYNKVLTYKLNPKSIDEKELFGWVDLKNQQSNIGVFSSIMSNVCTKADNEDDEKWIVFDGPIDTKWIESMNSLLDDNKVLTLLDGNRINLHKSVSLLFEVDSLDNASPATVSRCGMIYLDSNDLKIIDIFESWLKRVVKDAGPPPPSTNNMIVPPLADVLYELWEKWVEPLLIKKKKNCIDLIPTSDVHLVKNMLKLLDILAKDPMNGISYDEKNKDEIYWIKFEKFFAFSFIWSIANVVTDDYRKFMDIQIREIENFFPFSQTVFDYYINLEKNEWSLWEDKITIQPNSWKPPANVPAHRFLVETSETVRRRYLINYLLQKQVSTLIVGVTGTGKSAIVNSVLQNWDDSEYIYLIINLSAMTTSPKLQEIIESKLWKQTKTKIRPPAGKKAIIFVDDLNMPKPNSFGSQPPLELIRQYMEHGGWYDREKRDLFVEVKETQILCAMGPPGGGRNDISQRLSSKFHITSFSVPNDNQLKRIFQSILYFKLFDFDNDQVKGYIEHCVNFILALYKNIQTDEALKPTPTKSHYLFNLRDISRTVQGICLINKFNCDNKKTFLRLMIHECKRQFMDRLVSETDKKVFKQLCSEQLEHFCQTNYLEVMGENDDSIFLDFMDEDRQYREHALSNINELRSTMQKLLESYNKEEKNQMNIVLFLQAIEYTCRINRILKLSNGHGLLIGEGGSGRHSLTKLASYLAKYKTFQIKITKNFTHNHFRNEIKGLFDRLINKINPLTFTFSDNEILNESFIEDINDMLSLGEIPNLFIKKDTKDDFAPIRDKIRKLKGNTKDRDSDELIYDEFLSIVQKNLHIIFCISQNGPNLRNYSRQYPGLTSNTTQIWFTDWPEDALKEVAFHYLQQLNFDETQTLAIAEFFGKVHSKIIQMTDKMKKELKRNYMVTPKSYIDYVTGFSNLLIAKRREFSNEISKLEKGLEKLSEAHQNVEDLKNEMEKKRFNVQSKKRDAENLLLEITKQKKEAEKEQSKIEEKSKLIKVEYDETEKISKIAEEEVQKASEPMEKCKEIINGLTNREMSILKNIANKANPDMRVQIILGAVMIIIGEEDTSMATVNRKLADPSFLNLMTNAEFDKIRERKLLKIQKFTQRKEMDKDKMEQFSTEAKLIWEYVLSVEKYAKTNCDVEPKRKQVAQLRERLEKAKAELNLLLDKLKLLEEEIKSKQADLQKYWNDYEEYKNEFSRLEERLEKAERLYGLLSSSQGIWENEAVEWKQKFGKLNGDILLVASYLNYVGPFPYEYRIEYLENMLKPGVLKTKLVFSKDWKFNHFLATEAEIIDWQFDGLPSDPFSAENSVLVTKSPRFPLMIDPQNQANSWIKTMETKDGKILKVLDQGNEKIMNEIERAITHGYAVLLQNVEEDIDPSLEPVLNKLLKKKVSEKKGEYLVIYLGDDSEIPYNPNFRLYITTKMNNPVYKPEISTKVTLINFTVKESGLEEQLMGDFLQIWDEKIENDRKNCIKMEATGKVTLRVLEDKVLNKLNTIEGSLIDDENLMNILQESKDTEEKVRESMEISKAALIKVNKTRENFSYIGKIASLLYFTIYNLNVIDPMYQFSLESFKRIFKAEVEGSKNKPSSMNEALKDRLSQMDANLRDKVFRWACNGLFERDKILLSLMLAIKFGPIDEEQRKKKKAEEDASGKGGQRPGKQVEEEVEQKVEEEKKGDNDNAPKLNLAEVFQEEWNFFLKGGLVLDRENQPQNPDKDMIKESMWDNITEMDKLSNFTGIVGGFTHNIKEWKRWYYSSQPEIEPLPSDWSSRIENFSKLVLLRGIRPDRVIIGSQIYVKEILGQKFVNFPQFSIEEIYNESTPQVPTLFILSPGADPLYFLNQLKDQKEKQLIPISLGQGQTDKAKKQLHEGASKGFWVYLANIHLSLGFLKDLEKIIEDLEKNKKIHLDFRLWMSASPSSKFPITILQKCIKITTEPPKGIKAGMKKIFSSLVPDKYGDKKAVDKKEETKDNTTVGGSTAKAEEKVNEIKKYKKLLFSLSWFHVLINERQKFKSLGWNVKYDFNDSDFLYSERIIRKMVDQNLDKIGNQTFQWEAIRFLLSDIVYGGRVTDQFDQRLLTKYCEDFFKDELISAKEFEYTKDKQMVNYKLPIDPNDENEKPKGGRNQQQQKQTVADVKKFYLEYVEEFFDTIDLPVLFGQHANSETSSQIADTNRLIDSLLALQPKDSNLGTESREVTLQKILDGLTPKIPNQIDYFKAYEKQKPIESNPLKSVLMQEISRYNVTVGKVRQSCEEMVKALKGQILINEEIEKNLVSVYENKVPVSWKISYYSIKQLTSWIVDLKERVDFIHDWAFKAQPSAFWVGAFTLPTGFTTALFQQAARKNDKPIDTYRFDFIFENKDIKSVNAPRDGAFTYGYFLEGAKWDFSDSRIVEADPLKLLSPMPIIHFKPVDSKNTKVVKQSKTYTCPTYIYPIREGTRENPSYMFTITLPAGPDGYGVYDESIWIKKGVALLLSTDQ